MALGREGETALLWTPVMSANEGRVPHNRWKAWGLNRVYATWHDGAHRKRLWTHRSPLVVSSTIVYTTIFDVFGLFIVSSKWKTRLYFYFRLRRISAMSEYFLKILLYLSFYITLFSLIRDQIFFDHNSLLSRILTGSVSLRPNYSASRPVGSQNSM